MAATTDISLSALQPTGAQTTISSGNSWGVDGKFNTAGLSNLIIQSETFVDEPQIDQTFDQKNRLVHELTYDHKYTVTLEVIGCGELAASALSALNPNQTVAYTPSNQSQATWIVRSNQYNGSYNDKKKWSITLERWSHFPTLPTT